MITEHETWGSVTTGELRAHRVLYQGVYITYIQLHSSHVKHCFSFFKPLGNSAPVDDLPDGTEILSLAILVLQVVSMLPGVNTQERLKVTSDGILVGTSDKRQRARGLVFDEPGPARALDASKSRVGLLLQVFERPEIFIDGGLRERAIVSIHVRPQRLTRARSTYQKFALGLTTTALSIGGQVLPEKGVVKVATTVEVQKRTLSSGRFGVVRGKGLSKHLAGGIEAVHIGLVVLGMMELHDLAGDEGLESSIVIYWRQAIAQGISDICSSSHTRRCENHADATEPTGIDLQGRSGRVALPRTKLVLAMAMGLAARRPALTMGVVRRSADDMVGSVFGNDESVSFRRERHL